jgi:hypothetical protein
MKTYKVIFVGRGRLSKFDYMKQTVTLQLKKRPVDESGVLPELNKNWEVYELLEIWELIY